MSSNYSNVCIFKNNTGNEFIYSGATGLILGYNNRVKNFLELSGNDEELKELLFKKKEDKKTISEKGFFTSLMLFITNNCNLKCSYCYERATNLHDVKEMDLKTVENTMVYFLENLNHPKVIGINFFGGEPLLNFSLIKNSRDLFNELANKYDVRFTYGLTTNGTLINDEIREFLIENNVSIQVSIDGFEDTHNINRKFLNGDGSYKIIVDNVRKLSEYCDVSARVTVTDFDSDLIRMYEELERIGFSSMKIECVVSDAFTNCRDEIDNFAKQLKLLADYFINNIKSRKIINFSNIISHLKNLHFGVRPTLFPCPTGISRYSIATDGSIYFCHRFNNIPEYKWGDVHNGLVDIKRLNFLQNHQITVRGNEKCNECWALQNCGGTCYHASYIERGDTKLISLFYCEFRKLIFENALYIYGSLTEEDKVFLDNIKTDSMKI